MKSRNYDREFKLNAVRLHTSGGKKASKVCKDLGIPSRIAPNLVNQNFIVPEKNRVWVSDITYIETDEGWLYLAATMDLYSRMLVGLSMDSF